MKINSIPDPVGGIRTSDASGYRNEDRDTNEGRAFISGASVVGVASQYSHIQLLNPAGSGKVILVDQIIVGTYAITGLVINAHDTALTTLKDNFINKQMGSADGVGELRSETAVAIAGTTFLLSRTPAHTTTMFNFKEPIELAEGKGILVSGLTIATSLAASYQGREI